jgi:hydrogenase-4 component F
MVYLLILFPLAIAAAAFFFPSRRWRPWLVTLGGTGHLMLTILALVQASKGEIISGGEVLLLDALGKVFLGFVSVLFFLCSLYAPAYLALRQDRANRVFCANLLVVLSMMTLVILSQHLGLMWVGMEATTLACAPLLYFNQNPRSLEATWKFLLVGSVGIALALLGSFFLAYSSLKGGLESTLIFARLVAHASELSPEWLHTAFVLLFVGYGAKMGLAPMHTWKPDAYGEAPGVVGTLLAGGVTSCAFLSLLRVYQICRASSESEFARELLMFMGILSMAVAAVFMVRQRDFKRMLAYSSVEHMGILILGIGLGGIGVYGALLHMLNNGFTKGVLFLSAGNIHRAYGSKRTDDVRGALERVPVSGALFFAGFLAITGAPPFGPFVSEFTIASAAMIKGEFLAGALYLLLLGVIFIGMGATVLGIVQGTPSSTTAENGYRDSLATCAPVLLFLALVLLLGLYVPAPLDALLTDARNFLEGHP